MDGNVCPQDPLKSSLILPAKKSVLFPSEVQENPAKAALFHKQPPALPPKPFTRQLSHSIGEEEHMNERDLYCRSLSYFVLIIHLPLDQSHVRHWSCPAFKGNTLLLFLLRRWWFACHPEDWSYPSPPQALSLPTPGSVLPWCTTAAWGGTMDTRTSCSTAASPAASSKSSTRPWRFPCRGSRGQAGAQGGGLETGLPGIRTKSHNLQYKDMKPYHRQSHRGSCLLL